MTYQEFKKVLKQNELNIIKFANLVGMHPKSITTNWNKMGKIPKWAVLILTYYQEVKLLKDFKEKLNQVELQKLDQF